MEFFITVVSGGYQIMGGNDEPLIDDVFLTKESAADMAVRFAQDCGANSYRIYY